VNNALKWRIGSTNPNIILVEPSDQVLNSKEKAIIGVINIRPQE
jgi:hypothetical protein